MEDPSGSSETRSCKKTRQAILPGITLPNRPGTQPGSLHMIQCSLLGNTQLELINLQGAQDFSQNSPPMEVEIKCSVFVFHQSDCNTMLLLLLLLCGQARILNCPCVFSHISLEAPLDKLININKYHHLIKQSPLNLSLEDTFPDLEPIIFYCVFSNFPSQLF